ncbi:unnamed protein product [Ixodes pacificus]
MDKQTMLHFNQHPVQGSHDSYFHSVLKSHRVKPTPKINASRKLRPDMCSHRCCFFGTTLRRNKCSECRLFILTMPGYAPRYTPLRLATNRTKRYELSQPIQRREIIAQPSALSVAAPLTKVT